MIREEETTQKPLQKTSNFRNAASQYFAASVSNLVMLTSGTFFGFTTIFITELSRQDAEIQVSKDELTWFSSYLFMQPIGALVIGVVSQWIGSRKTLLLASMFFTVSCLMFHYATSSAMILVAQGICSICYINGPGVTYIVEITQPDLRSVAMATANFSQTFGSLLTVILASFLYWRTVVLVNLFFAGLGFASVFLIPDSPHWLASKGRLDEAEKSLAWLRGWTSADNVKLELDSLREGYSATGATTDSQGISMSHFRASVESYRQRSFLLPLASVCYVFIIRALMGSMAVQTFCDTIFEMINAPHARYLTIAVYAVDISGAVTYMSLVRFIGKRRLMFASLVAAGLSYAVVSLFVFLARNGHDSEVYRWVPAVAILFLIYVTSAGIDTIVSMLNGELFPSRFRNLGAGIGMFVSSVSMAAMGKAFLYMVDAMTLQGVFLFFAGVGAVGLVSFYVILPETEGCTLMEIEQHYAGVRSLGDRSIGRSKKEQVEYGNPVFNSS